MTAEEKHDAALMRLVRRYEGQKSKVACLEFQIREFASPLLTLGTAIKTDFERVTPSQDGDNRFLIRALPHHHRQEADALTIDLAHLRVLLADYREAVAEQEQIEGCMERGGLTRFIR